jgi:hypothetical protein
MAIPEWVFSAVVGLAVGFIFFYLDLKGELGRLSKDVGDLMSKIKELIPEMRRYPPVNADSIEGKLVAFAEGEHATIRRDLSEDREMNIFDFDGGWSLLFDQFFSGQSDCLLRDVTFSGYGETAVQAYSFSSYPALIKRHLEKCKDVRHKVQFLVVCCPSIGKGNEVAEMFLIELLQIKYGNHRYDDLVALWRDGNPGEKHWVDIMITNERIFGQVLGQVEEKVGDGVDYPFNVYGDFAVSRSFVKPNKTDRNPLPHLNILIEKKKIGRFQSLFDLVWRGSTEFKTKALNRMDKAQMGTIGDGKILDEWSRLD